MRPIRWREQRDFKLQIGGDLRRFEELTAVITRFASQSEIATSSTLQRMSQQYYGDYDEGDDYHEDYWQDAWDDYDWQDSDDWQEDYYSEWPSDSDGEWTFADWEEHSPDTENENSQELYGGKRKFGTKGKGKARCTACGSRFHTSDDCPLNAAGGQGQAPKGKGEGKGKASNFGTPFGKGQQFKGKGDKQRKGKGKGKRKGKGKGKGKKGKSLRRG